MMAGMQYARRLRQIACLIHVALAGAGAAALGSVRDLSGAAAARHFTLLAVGVAAVLHVLHPRWPASRRHLTVWAVALLLVSAGPAALFGTGSVSGRLGVLAVSAWCLSCIVNAAGMVWLLGPGGLQARRFSSRVGLALFVGLLGLAPTLAFRQASAIGPALLAVSSLGALALGASQLEAAVALRDNLRAARIASNLLTGVWLGLCAIAAASLALSASTLALAVQGKAPAGEAWVAAMSAARLSWLHTFPLVGAALVVFAGRLQLAGLGAATSLGSALPVALIAAVGIVGGRHGLRNDAQIMAEAAAVPLPSRMARPQLAPAPSVVSSAERPEPVPPPASAAPAPSAAVPPAATGRPIAIEALTATGILEADARTGIERRMKLLDECAAKTPLTQPGTLRSRVFIDPNGSVLAVKPLGGEHADTPFAQCAMLSYYRMGFASKGTSASFEVTLRAAPTAP